MTLRTESRILREGLPVRQVLSADFGLKPNLHEVNW